MGNPGREVGSTHNEEVSEAEGRCVATGSFEERRSCVRPHHSTRILRGALRQCREFRIRDSRELIVRQLHDYAIRRSDQATTGLARLFPMVPDSPDGWFVSGASGAKAAPAARYRAFPGGGTSRTAQYRTASLNPQSNISKVEGSDSTGSRERAPRPRPYIDSIVPSSASRAISNSQSLLTRAATRVADMGSDPK